MRRILQERWDASFFVLFHDWRGNNLDENKDLLGGKKHERKNMKERNVINFGAVSFWVLLICFSPTAKRRPKTKIDWNLCKRFKPKSHTEPCIQMKRRAIRYLVYVVNFKGIYS